MKKLRIILPLGMIALTLASCKPEESSTETTPPITDTTSPTDTHTYYTVSFDSQGGSEVESQQVMENNPVVMPNNPVYDDHSFVGWYKTPQANEDTEWNFSTDRVTSDIILYASWLSDTAQEEPTTSLTYEKVENGYEVTGVGSDERVIIPAQYENEDVVSIGSSAFARKQITYVSIPDTVISIGLNAFNNASSLKEVNIGANSRLTSIGNNAFSGNASLESIYIPKGVETIGNSAFNNASSLNTIVVSNENNNYYSTGNNLIESSTETLIRGSNSSTIPNGVKIIASAAFRRSTITNITIPQSVESIGNYAFDDCTALTTITVNENNQSYSSQSGVLYNKTQTTLIKVPEGSNNEIVIPNTISEIPSFAFDGIATIPSVEIPTSVTSIRSFAFRNTNLTINYEGTSEEWEAVSKHSTWGGGNLNINFSSSEDDNIDVYTIYFSATGSTSRIANMISEYTNSRIYEITALNPYTSADLNYSNSSCRANQDQNDPSARPLIGSETIDLTNYEVIYLGYPIWWGKAPKIIYTFLETYNLEGKTIIPFCTSGSSGINGSLSEIKALEPNATWLNGQRFSASANQSTITNWIDSLNY